MFHANVSGGGFRLQCLSPRVHRHEKTAHDSFKGPSVGGSAHQCASMRVSNVVLPKSMHEQARAVVDTQEPRRGVHTERLRRLPVTDSTPKHRARGRSGCTKKSAGKKFESWLLRARARCGHAADCRHLRERFESRPLNQLRNSSRGSLDSKSICLRIMAR